MLVYILNNINKVSYLQNTPKINNKVGTLRKYNSSGAKQKKIVEQQNCGIFIQCAYNIFLQSIKKN